MAIYVPPSTRRRRLVLLVGAGLVVGLVLGFVLGRATSSGVDDAVGGVRDKATSAATALQRLPIEYEQAAAGTGGESTRTITEAVDRARAELAAAWRDADWFGPAVRRPVDAALAGVARAATDRVSQEAFQAAVDKAVTSIEDAFGVSVGEGS